MTRTLGMRERASVKRHKRTMIYSSRCHLCHDGGKPCSWHKLGNKKRSVYLGKLFSNSHQTVAEPESTIKDRDGHLNKSLHSPH
jgi:hypothetical protein